MSCRAPVPSALAIHTWEPLALFPSKVTWRPSFDQRGVATATSRSSRIVWDPSAFGLIKVAPCAASTRSQASPSARGYVMTVGPDADEGELAEGLGLTGTALGTARPPVPTTAIAAMATSRAPSAAKMIMGRGIAGVLHGRHSARCLVPWTSFRIPVSRRSESSSGPPCMKVWMSSSTSRSRVMPDAPGNRGPSGRQLRATPASRWWRDAIGTWRSRPGYRVGPRLPGA